MDHLYEQLRKSPAMCYRHVLKHGVNREDFSNIRAAMIGGFTVRLETPTEYSADPSLTLSCKRGRTLPRCGLSRRTTTASDSADPKLHGPNRACSN
jgi:hypothetical protein